MIAVVITAAGRSLRMGGKKKEFLELGNGTILSETAKAFLKSIEVAHMVITYASDTPEAQSLARAALFADDEIKKLSEKTNLIFAQGGDTRQESVRNALEALSKASTGTDTAQNFSPPQIVLVHDGARPFVDGAVIRRVAGAAQTHGAAVPAVGPVDTLKQKNDDGFIEKHLTRSQISAVQTPQGFRFGELLEAHRKAANDGKTYTDDSEIWGAYCGEVKIVDGDIANKKITYAGDLPAASESAAHSQATASSEISATSQATAHSESAAAPSFRTGFGYDLHRLVSGRKLIIGGVTIPSEKGEDGHSDGDVLLHAVTDALLGAAALGDIGSFFPPSDDTWKGADSVQLLQTAWQKVKSAGWKLCNMDCVVKLEKPKLLPFREKICAAIASALGVDGDKVFIKAKTAEKLGDVGSGEAIEAWATCLLVR